MSSSSLGILTLDGYDLSKCFTFKLRYFTFIKLHFKVIPLDFIQSHCPEWAIYCKCSISRAITDIIADIHQLDSLHKVIDKKSFGFHIKIIISLTNGDIYPLIHLLICFGYEEVQKHI